MNLEKNIIFIEFGKYSDIKKALKQWIELYQNELDLSLKFRLFKFKETHTIIELNKEIENKLFIYLINYLTYPENIKYNVLVKGFTLIKDTKIFPESLLNQPVQISVPKNNKDFDVVFGVTKFGDAYKIDFVGKSVKTNPDVIYFKPSYKYKNSPSEIVEINKKKLVKKWNNKEIEKFNYRFLIISSIFLAGTMIFGYLTYKTEYFVTFVKISSFGLLLWTMFEYELFRVNSVYLKFLSLSVLLSLLGHYIFSLENSNDIWLKSTKMSLCFLILYKILRYIYLSIYNREPDFDKNAELVVDRIYYFVSIPS